jgi:kynurenine formamidase
MKIRTFVIGYVLALALLVFANRRSEIPPNSGFRSVIDLTSTSAGNNKVQAAASRKSPIEPGKATQIVAPSSYSPKLWSVDQIPGERLVAPLAVIHANGSSPVSMNDVVSYEKNYGEIPLGSVVLARAQGDVSNAAFSSDAMKFLLHARNVIGIGMEAEMMRNSEPDTYALSHSAYLLNNLNNLEKVPASGSMVMVAPSKLRAATAGPVRVLALVR